MYLLIFKYNWISKPDNTIVISPDDGTDCSVNLYMIGLSEYVYTILMCSFYNIKSISTSETEYAIDLLASDTGLAPI